MKFRCERDTLAEAVATAQRAVASRTGAMPVLSGLRVSVGAGFAGAGRHRPRAHDPGAGAGGERRARASAVVPARLFSEIVRQLEGGTVTVELADDDAQIEAGRFATTLRTLSAAEFPRLPETTETGVRVAAGAFAEALRQVVPAASRDDARPILTGVLLTASSGGLRLVATDSYRLALRDLQGVSMLDEGQKVLVAAKGLVEVQRLLASADGEIEVVLGEREVVFRVGHHRSHHAADRGRVPELPAAHPERLPEPSHRAARGAPGRGEPRASRRSEPRHGAHPPRHDVGRASSCRRSRRTSAKRTNRWRRSTRAPSSPSRSTRSSSSTASTPPRPTRSCSSRSTR